MKNYLHSQTRFAKLWRKIFVILFLSITSLTTYANNGDNMLVQFSTQKSVTLKYTNVGIRKILTEIKKQSGVGFAISNTIIEVDLNSLSIDVVNVTIETALTTLLKDSNYEYQIIENHIIIKPRVKTKSQKEQSVKINGKIVDRENKQPIVGATIIITGTTKGAITDDKGQFSLEAKASDKIEITFLGYKPFIYEVVLEESNPILSITRELLEISDVVVNGIFERNSGTFTGAVATFKNEDLKRVSNSNVLQALKNLDPSILFYENMEYGSDPNRVPEMSMRGKTSLNIAASAESDLRELYQNDPNAPLFVLDGFEVSVAKVMDLDMNRVETITILKDASAKAIYGAKAANGVVVIELKKNTQEKLRVIYNGSVEIQAPDLTSYNLTSAAEKLDVEVAHGLFEDPKGYFSDAQRQLNQLYTQKLTYVLSGINTDWMSKPLQLGVGTKHGVSVELGEKALKAIVNLSYNNVKGVMKGSDRTNISGGVTLNYRHKKFLFSNQLTITSNVSNNSKYGSFSEYTVLNPYYSPYSQQGELMMNIVPPISKDVSLGEWYGKLSFIPNPIYNGSLNSVLQQKYIDVTNNFSLQYNIFTSLKATAKFGFTEQRQKGDTFYPADHLMFISMTEENALRKGSYTLTQGEQSNVSGKFDLQYSKKIFSKGMLYCNGGFDLAQKKNSSNTIRTEGFPSEMMTDIMFARQYIQNSKPTGSEQTVRDIGYYLSLNYSFDERINIDGTFRQTASSIYGANSRWGAFWSVGIGWNIHKEKWINEELFPNLRLRASIGSTGSQSSAAYNAIATYSYFLDRTYEGLIGTQLMSMKNDDLKWQNKFDKNIGVDVQIKKNLSLRFDYYISITNNALNPLTLSPSTGFVSVQENSGKIENKGFDLRATYTVWRSPKERAYLSLMASISRNKNTLKEISSALKAYNAQQNMNSNNGVDANGNKTIKPIQKYYDGVSMDAIWAIRSLGIDPANGLELFLRKDEAGNYYRSYEYDANAQEICGDALPKLHGNFGFTFEYKGFSVNAVLSFKYGGQMYNSTLVSKVENADLSQNVDRRIFTDRWRKPGDQTPYKRIQKVSYLTPDNLKVSETTPPTSRFVQDRNELNISSLQLSYDFSYLKFVKKIGLERLRIAINTNDLLTLSSIEIERGTQYPFARTFNGSLSFTF